MVESCKNEEESQVANVIFLNGRLRKSWTFHWYGSYISRIFLEYFHTTENISILWNWTKLWKLDIPTFFYNIPKNISILWKRSNFYQCENLRKRDTCALWEQAIDLCRIKHESNNVSRLGLLTDLPCTEDWTCKTVTRTDKQHMANRSFILNLF